MSREPHRKTIRHFDDEGHARSLTLSCYQRQQFLSRDRSRQWMLDAIELGRQKHAVHLWAYVIMPEHVHLLIWPSQPGYKIKHSLTTVKQSISKMARIYLCQESPDYLASLGGEFHFWQADPGYDRNLWSDHYIWETIDYFHANPVRRQLCQRPVDWPWSSARAHTGEPDPFLKIDFKSLPADPRR